ncbi:hypothetical protein SAMN06295924_1364 [Rathayibacter rathayi NCPPB 2980 = VKM Ac-1601]|nr:hypothetical protein SAMN06295924_1364 [Rathayibacter rathayi NCPPB 2980 = VKM Ac-1601]
MARFRIVIPPLSSLNVREFLTGCVESVQELRWFLGYRAMENIGSRGPGARIEFAECLSGVREVRF